MKFIFPIDGDVLTPADGRLEEGRLLVCVRISAPAGARQVMINGCPAIKEGTFWALELAFEAGKTRLEATAGAERAEITVYRFPKADRKYRLAIDDIIWTLRDVAEKGYTSLFENPFFALFRGLYEEFGTKTHLNIYYHDGAGFNLSMFPDRYRAEFEAAAAWMRLTFHARCDQPDHIYRTAPYEEIRRDFEQVTAEIRRFAGDRIWREPVNGLHFAETTRAGARALRDCGIRCLLGYYIFDRKGNPAVSYYLDRAQTEHAAGRDFWVDNSEGIIFSKDKLVLDAWPLAEIPAQLDALSPQLAGTVNFVTHEQYFYPFYSHYQPDYPEKLRAAVRWATERGYEPCFLGDVLE